MNSPIASVSAAEPVAPATPANQTPPESKPPAAPADSTPAAVVHLSEAAQAALREATETPAQTAKEAASGDIQAKHLLAKRTAAKAAAEAKLHIVA